MQAHASAAVVNFSENCDQELLPPYLDTLITKLMMLLQNGQRMVQVSHWVILADAAPKSSPMDPYPSRICHHTATIAIGLDPTSRPGLLIDHWTICSSMIMGASI